MILLALGLALSPTAHAQSNTEDLEYRRPELEKKKGQKLDVKAGFEAEWLEVGDLDFRALDESSAYKRFAFERSMAEQQTEKPTNAHPLQMARYEASASKQLYQQTDNAEKSTAEKKESDGDKKKKKKKKQKKKEKKKEEEKKKKKKEEAEKKKKKKKQNENNKKKKNKKKKKKKKK